MKKALFIDFYGTLVHEDGEIIKRISQIIMDTGTAVSTDEIGGYWWNEFRVLFTGSYGESFRTQRELETVSLRRTLERFHSSADADLLSKQLFEHWIKPPPFPDSHEFLKKCPLPVYIVSNIDTDDIIRAVEYNGFEPAGIYTSEDARSYKPRPEIFEYAAKKAGVRPEGIIHIGDSLSGDVTGAAAAGIDAVWLNRGGKQVPDGVTAVNGLLKLLENGAI